LTPDRHVLLTPQPQILGAFRRDLPASDNWRCSFLRIWSTAFNTWRIT
jgi:hypothetical protein